jgi:hypothetical protein
MLIEGDEVARHVFFKERHGHKVDQKALAAGLWASRQVEV